MGTNNVVSQIQLNDKLSSNYDDYKYKLDAKQGIFDSNAFKISPTSNRKHPCTHFESELIGPMLSGAMPPSKDLDLKESKINKVRRNFPEVWIYAVNETSSGILEVSKRVPDSITTWMISGYSINADAGFAIAKPQKIPVFQDFFIKVQKPSSVKMSEVVNLKVIIYNFTPGPMTTTVTLHNRDNQFDFMNRNIAENKFSKALNTQVKSGSTAAVVFKIKPKVTGKVFLNILATTNTNTMDGIEDTFTVETLGINKHETKTRLIDLKRSTNYSDQMEFKNLDKALDDSVTFEVTTTTDLIGPAMDNIENLM